MLLEQTLDSVVELLCGCLEQSRSTRNLRFDASQVPEGIEAGRRLDAANAGGKAGLGKHLEEADVAGSIGVRPAAKLEGRPDREHADDLTVLLLENTDRAAALGLVHRQRFGRNLRVLEHA